MSRKAVFCFCCVVSVIVSPLLSQTVLLEAEGFLNRAGWVLDQQFMDEIGSPYLLAHGLGRPVQDATTVVQFPKTGTWHCWVRTKNWVAPFGTSEAPGRFQLCVNGINQRGFGFKIVEKRTGPHSCVFGNARSRGIPKAFLCKQVDGRFN